MPIRSRFLAVTATAVVLGMLSAACSDGGAGSTASTTVPGTTSTAAPATPDPPSTTTAGTTAAPLGSVNVRPTRVATLAQPLALAVRPGDDTLYVAEKGGKVVGVHEGADPTTVLDLTGSVATGSEQGLLGLVFSPDGGRLYVNYTDPAGDTRIVEYAYDGGRADPASARELLIVDQPFANHNGGNLVFGPDGMLWIGLGDGGGGGDPAGNAQSLGTLLGKMLRIDPRPSGRLPYTVPADNPFVGTDGARGRSGPSGCATPGATRSTGPPATCGSATWARAPRRRSTSRRPARREGSTSVGP